jgi:hypothetical protein
MNSQITNSLMIEIQMAEEHRNDVFRNSHDLEPQGKSFRPNWFTRTMQVFGQWMIVRGKKLVQRYEVTSNNNSQSSAQGYAH